MDKLPNADRAERNQERKLEFIPVWPLLAAVVLFVVAYLLFR
jgi:type VI protein secretion system component VasF